MIFVNVAAFLSFYFSIICYNIHIHLLAKHKVNRNEQEVEKYLGNQMPIEKAIGRMNICKLMHWFIRYAFSVMKFNIITVAVIDSF